MKEYKIIDVIGDFSVLVRETVKAESEEEAKKIVIEIVRKDIDHYLYAVVDEIKESD